MARDLLIGLFALAVAGCPMRDVGVSISSNGANTVLTACNNGCWHEGDGGVPFGMGWGETNCECELSGSPWPDFRRELQARLFVVSPSQAFSVQDASKCMSIEPCGEGGLSRSNHCLAERLNQQLDGAMPKGLTSDGLRNPDDVLLVLAFYQPPAGSDASCTIDSLFACAGLSAPLGGGSFDIACSSCQGSSRTPTGSDTGPCPRDTNDRNGCFLRTCYGFLQNATM
jgi:hypothetical protein